MKKTVEELISRQNEINDTLGGFDNTLQERELNAEEKASREALLAEYDRNKREIETGIQTKKNAAVTVAPKKDVNTELREFLREAKPGKSFNIPMTRESMSYGSQGSAGYPGTAPYVQGITVVDLIETDRPDNDILLTAGVPMTTGVVGNKIQWAFAGGVEAVVESAQGVVDLVLARNKLFNSFFHFALKAAASTTKATETFFGGFAQDAESGTYGEDGYTPGKQTGTYENFTKDTAAAMVAKIAKRNLDLDTAVFVMGASDFWKLKVTPFDQGSGIMLIGNDNRLLGIPVVVCNAINRATEKGAASGHNIGLGIFKYLPTMQHGNIRLSVDAGSMTAASTDEVVTTINADFSMTVLKAAADAFVVYSKTGAYSSGDDI